MQCRKKSLIIIFAAILKKHCCFLLMLFFGCLCFSLGAENKVELKIESFDKAYEKTYGKNHRVEFEFHLTLLSNVPKTERILKRLIYNNKNPSAYIAQKEKLFLETIRKSAYPSSIDDGSTTYLYHSTYLENFEIVNINRDFVTLRYTDYFYPALSAHGMFHEKYFIIDLAAQKILNIPDLFHTAIPENELAKYIAQKYSDFPVNYRGAFWPPGSINFGVRGITILWDLYAIAPYSFGIIEITLPYTAAEKYLTPKGKTLRETYLVQ